MEETIDKKRRIATIENIAVWCEGLGLKITLPYLECVTAVRAHSFTCEKQKEVQYVFCPYQEEELFFPITHTGQC